MERKVLSNLSISKIPLKLSQKGSNSTNKKKLNTAKRPQQITFLRSKICAVRDFLNFQTGKLLTRDYLK